MKNSSDTIGNRTHDLPTCSADSSTLACICVVRLLFVLFCVSFVCKCLLPPSDNPIAVNKYIISSYKLTPRPFYPRKVRRYLLTRRMGSPRAGMNDSGKKKSFISAGIRTANRTARRAFAVPRLRKLFRLFKHQKTVLR